MLAELTLQSFEPLIGERFWCRLGDAGPAVDLELREACGSGGAGLRGSRMPFSLLFHGALEEAPPQQIYALSHARFSEPLPLFLVPVGQADGGFLLEAVFN